jgi:hypothetical protein
VWVVSQYTLVALIAMIIMPLEYVSRAIGAIMIVRRQTIERLVGAHGYTIKYLTIKT